MSYVYESESGQQFVAENDGDYTQVSLSSGSEGQQQSQGTGFETGKWLKPPTLYRLDRDLVLRLETGNGPQFIRVRGSEIRRLQSEPDLEAAEKLPFSKHDRPSRMRPMEPMKPMEPMRPMQMRMGNMQMSMGGAEGPRAEEPRTEVAQRFCTQCGQPVSKGDRFCGQCGHPLGKRD